MRVTGMSKRLWLFLLEQGGRWNMSELTDALNEDKSTVSGTARSLVEAQMLRRYGREESASGRVEYGLTACCRIPREISLADLQGRT